MRTQKADEGTYGWHFGSTGTISENDYILLSNWPKTIWETKDPPTDLFGLFTLHTNFGENEFLIERAICF